MREEIFGGRTCRIEIERVEGKTASAVGRDRGRLR